MAKIDSGVNTSGMTNITENFHLQVNASTGITKNGFTIISGRGDDGSVVSGGQINPIYVTEGGRISISYSSILWDDTFNATVQNTSKYKVSTTTQTIVFSGGTAVLNGSNITTSNTNSVLQTYRQFPLFAKSETRVSISALHTATPQSNTITEFGCFTMSSNALPPIDGAFFRYDVSGQLRGVISYSGTQYQTSALTLPTSGVNHDYQIIIQTNNVLFYIDDILNGRINLSTDAPTLGQPFAAAALPITIRHYITGTTPSVAFQFKVSDLFVILNGSELTKPWSESRVFLGGSGYEGQDGGTLGTTALYSNSLLANTGLILNNDTSAGIGFGGQFTVQPTLTAGTDGIVCSFQIPSGSTTQTPKNLFIKGVKINSSVNQTITGGPVLYAYSLAYGHTSEAMSTTTTQTSKAPVRIPLGYESFAVNAVSGVTSTFFPTMKFTCPIMVCPGEYVSICAKNLGVVTSGGLITVNISFDAFYD